MILKNPQRINNVLPVIVLAALLGQFLNYFPFDEFSKISLKNATYKSKD